MEDDELSVQDETDGLFQYQRVSVGLQNDPDLKQFYVKSSSYEDLTIGPYHEPLIDSSDSTPSTGRNTPEEHSNRDTFKGKLNSTSADNLIKSQKSQDDSVIQTGKAIPMPLPRKSLSTKKLDNNSGKVPLAPPRRNRSPLMYVKNEASHVKLDSSVNNTKSSNESVTSERLIQGNKHNADASGDRLIRSNVNRTKNTQNKRSGVYQAGDFTDYPEKTSTSVSGNEEKSESSTKLVREVSINRSPAFRKVPRKSPLRQSFKQDKEEMDDMDIFDPLATEVRSENNPSFSCSNPVYEQYEIKKKVETQSCDLLQDWNVNQLVGQSSSTTDNKPRVPSPHRGMSNSISNPYYSRSNQPLQNNIPPPLPPKPSNLRATSMYSTHGPYITPQTAQIPVSPIIQSSGVNNRTSDPFDDLHSLTLQQGKQSGNTSPKPPSPNPRWEQFD